MERIFLLSAKSNHFQTMKRLCLLLTAVALARTLTITLAAETPSATHLVPSPDSVGNFTPSIANETDYATIIVKRPSGLFGQGGIRYVVDRGRGVVLDATVVEKLHFPDNVGDFCVPHNVNYFSARRSDALGQKSSKPNVSTLIIGRSFREDLEPNTALVGKFDSRGILIWTRPPGRMRLELVNANGNQSVCAPVEVEARKTYEITVHYGDRTRFVVATVSDYKSDHRQ